MKRTTTKKEPQKNTLFSYFASTRAPSKKESLSSLIDKTNPRTLQQTASNPSKARNQRRRQQQPIDLTNDIDNDDDIIMISSQKTVIDLESSQSSYRSTSSSQSSMSRLNTTEMVNSSKYNRKGWSVEAKQRGPLSSSQDSRLSQEKKPSQQFERLRINKPRITAKPSYEWLGPNDVKPYSSNFSPFVSAADHLKDDAPRITSQFERSNSQPYISSPTSSGGKRGWTDYDDSSSTSSYGSSWSTNSSNKRRTLPTKPKDTNWSKTKPSPGYSRQAYAKVSSGKSMTMSQMASLSASSTEFTPELSDEQKRVFDMVVRERKNIFFTGSAGTGKSVLLRAIIAKLRSTYGSRLAVTASTGIAACNINGCTLHRQVEAFGGIGIGAEKAEELAAKVEFNRRSSERWKETAVLIIDEISMVDAELFDKMDYIARRVRHTDAPFGGIQIVVTGDFFQLPPVNKDKVSKFAFEAESWRAAISRTVLLTQVFRQKDGTFVRILNEMRLGILSEEAISIFRSLSREPAACHDIKPTELYPLRHEVDDSNRRRLIELRGEQVEYTAIDEGDPRKMQQCIAPARLHLKLHAQVMLLKNMDTELVNGSLGVVVGFVGKGNYTNKEECERLRTPQRKRDRNSLFAAGKEGDGELDMTVPWPVVKFANDKEMIMEREAWSVALPGGRDVSRRRQIPLMLAWAISIHKSQGQTLDAVRVDLGKVFEKGQAYVALSRATSLERLQILNFDPVKVMAHPTVSDFYKTLQTIR
ncbi:DNA repair and recombination protein [Mucor ambiguus]|uniref:ATP-dependent DNA helicase PIF1 n=1 Tax=Mucor ambiguus TaxID=91626 RepID=A0A0C9MZV3_9FUNG|nr:DNA repair and recombination protein [Mucor ambiguus]